MQWVIENKILKRQNVGTGTQRGKGSNSLEWSEGFVEVLGTTSVWTQSLGTGLFGKER